MVALSSSTPLTPRKPLNGPHPLKDEAWLAGDTFVQQKRQSFSSSSGRIRPSVSADGFARGTWPGFQCPLTPLADYLCVGCNLPALSGDIAFCGSSAVCEPSPPC